VSFLCADGGDEADQSEDDQRGAGLHDAAGAELGGQTLGETKPPSEPNPVAGENATSSSWLAVVSLYCQTTVI